MVLRGGTTGGCDGKAEDAEVPPSGALASPASLTCPLDNAAQSDSLVTFCSVNLSSIRDHEFNARENRGLPFLFSICFIFLNDRLTNKQKQKMADTNGKNSATITKSIGLSFPGHIFSLIDIKTHVRRNQTTKLTAKEKAVRSNI
nr:MAG TPA: hypothetical protein [Caudoviricetes sp.]